MDDDRSSRKSRVIEYYDQESANYEELYSRGPLDTECYPANAYRLRLILERLRHYKATTLLDIGCGSAWPLASFLKEGFDAIGFDFSPQMVAHGKKHLAAAGHDPDRCFHADLEQRDTLPDRQFDALVVTGVFPHNLDDAAAYANLRALLAPGGVAFIEYRNAMMSLFSVNKHSVDFYWHDLLRADDLPEPLREQTRQFVSAKFDTSVESVGHKRPIEFSDILARFHNPLTLGAEIAHHGLRLVQTHFYHWHAAPPHLEKLHREIFWKASLALEGTSDWRGMFMCSAFVAEARRDNT